MMTELPFCLQPSKPSDNNDYESYKKGEFELEEWEDVNYCEHSFSYGDKGLTDREVVDLLNELHEENNELKSRLCDCHTFLSSKTMVENSNEELRKENEQLKQKNKGLQSELHIFKEDVTHSNKIIDKLNDENEQLQKKVESKQRVINAYEQYINDLKEDGVIE